jgi:hypothetical protein
LEGGWHGKLGKGISSADNNTDVSHTAILKKIWDIFCEFVYLEGYVF